MAPPDTRTIHNPTQLHVVHVKTVEKEQREDRKTKICWLCNALSFKMHNYEIIFRIMGVFFSNVDNLTVLLVALAVV